MHDINNFFFYSEYIHHDTSSSIYYLHGVIRKPSLRSWIWIETYCGFKHNTVVIYAYWNPLWLIGFVELQMGSFVVLHTLASFSLMLAFHLLLLWSFSYHDMNISPSFLMHKNHCFCPLYQYWQHTLNRYHCLW